MGGRFLCLALVVALACGNGRRPPASVQHAPANFGLWRIDQPILGEAQLANRFRYVANGAGVDVYIIDTGALLTNTDFGGRHQSVADMAVGNFFGSTTDNPVSSDVSDCSYLNPGGRYDGHGTHSASFAVGATYGVAKAARLHVLKVSGPVVHPCDGDNNAVIHAVNWITRNGRRPGVVNLSFRPRSEAVNQAILASIDAGFVYTLSAGCSPNVAGTWGTLAADQQQGALIVASTNASDRTGVSGPGPQDYGSALTLFAPGIGVTGAGSRSPTAFSMQPTNGTCADSFAAPHVAGVAAAFLERHPTATPGQVRAAILDHAAVNVPGLPKPMLQIF
jgi:serine protease